MNTTSIRIRRLRHLLPSSLAAFMAMSTPSLLHAQGALEPIRLHSREFVPDPGIAASAVAASDAAQAAGYSSVPLLVQFNAIPAPDQWLVWGPSGIQCLSWLGGNSYIIAIPLLPEVSGAASLAAAQGQLHARAYAGMEESDRVPAALHDKLAQLSPLDPPFTVVALFHHSATETECLAALAPFHTPGGPPPESIGPRAWKLPILPDQPPTYAGIPLLLRQTILHILSEGPLDLPMMDVTRKYNGADKVQSLVATSPLPAYSGYTGRGVKLSNGEGLDPAHDDFWNHNAGGAQTTQRWISGGWASGHGTMVAGIMLGNGWRSAAHGGAPFQFRGMAPEAIFTSRSSGEDAENRSYMPDALCYYSSWVHGVDSEVLGTGGAGTFHPIVYAVGNEGLSKVNGLENGYYSVLAPSKNAIVVANLHKSDLSWAGSSLGPTQDGRLKPDLAAPGTDRAMPDGVTSIPLELDYVHINAASPVQWTFNGGGAAWKGSWGVNGFWEQQYLGPITQTASARLTTSLLAGNWTQWDGSPMIGTLNYPNGVTPLAVDGAATDTVTLSYRLGPVPEFTAPAASIGFSYTGSPNGLFPGGNYVHFPVIADGAWHTATVPVGTHPNWAATTAVNPVNFLIVRFRDLAGMKTTGLGTNGYGGAGGSSAAAPVVTGALGLLMEQMKVEFGVALGTKTASPFTAAPGTGDPLPSTYKAVLLHTADDLASKPHAGELPNPDTGVQTMYHKGPDLATGYGHANVGEASRLLKAESAAAGQQFIREREFNAYATHTYNVTVPPNQTDPLRVTLAWDDVPGSPIAAGPVGRLVNDLDLELVAPNATIHYPWTVDAPYVPLSGPVAQYPENVEPEPITAASIKAARRDIPDHRNNMEQVCVEAPAAGVWTVRVKSVNLPCGGPQKYSLVTGMPPTPAQNINCGKVVYSSNRGQGEELFVKYVGSNSPPVQITNSSFTPHDAAWSPSGQHIAYIDTTVIVNNQPSTQVDMLVICTPSGSGVMQLPAPLLNNLYLAYPEWSPDGKKIVVTAHNNWGDRRLIVITFTNLINFSTWTSQQVVPSGTGAGDADFSPDGKFLYYNVDVGPSGNARRVPVTGGTPEVLYTNGTPMTRAYALSVSPDGRRLLYNSELWQVDPVAYLNEELLIHDQLTGVTTALTHEPGNQYGRYAKKGTGEYAMQWNSSVTGKTDIYLCTHNQRVKLDTADPSNIYNDGAMDWHKGSGNIIMDTAFMPAATPICNTQTQVTVPVTICNGGCAPAAFQLSARPIAGVSALPFVPYGVDGPTVFTWPSGNSITVPGGTCFTTGVIVTRPVGLNAVHLRAGFAITITNTTTGAVLEKAGELVDTGSSCISWNPPGDDPVGIMAGQSAVIRFQIENNGTEPMFVATTTSSAPDPSGFVVIPPGTVMMVEATVAGGAPGENGWAAVAAVDALGELTQLAVRSTRTVRAPNSAELSLSMAVLDDCRAGMQWLPGALMTNQEVSIQYGGFGWGANALLEESSDMVNWNLVEQLPPVDDTGHGTAALRRTSPRSFWRVRDADAPSHPGAP